MANSAINQAVETIKNLVWKQIRVQNLFIKDQFSLLLVPRISNTAGIENPFLNLFVFPDSPQTRCMIKESKDLFNLTAIISFNWDCIAKDDVNFLIEELQSRRCTLLHLELEEWHFEPLAIEATNLANHADGILETLRQRLLKGC